MNKQWKQVFITIMAVMLLVSVTACQNSESPATTEPVATAEQASTTDTQKPAVGEQTLDATEQLALGTLMLEETENAVTPEQANQLLPMWQLMQGGDLSSDAETTAVLKQIRNTMTDAQLTAINAISADDLQAWYGERGVQMPSPGDGEASGGAPGGMADDLNDEERAEMREKMQNMTDEEREQMRSEMGGQAPEGGTSGRGAAGGTGSGTALIRPLVMMLQQRAAE